MIRLASLFVALSFAVLIYGLMALPVPQMLAGFGVLAAVVAGFVARIAKQTRPGPIDRWWLE